MAAGDGVEAKLQERLESVGKNHHPHPRRRLYQVRHHCRCHTVDPRRCGTPRKQLGHLLVGVAEEQVTHRTASTRSVNWPTVINGTTPDVQAVREWRLASGRFFTADELNHSAAVCVIGDTVRRKLFGATADPVGQMLHVEQLPLRVVGVLTAKGRNPVGEDQDDEILVPITTLQQKLVGGAEKFT